MPTIADIKLKPPKILLYSQPGAGKTAFALTAGASAQVIDLDDGLITGKSLKDKWFSERQKVDVKLCHEESVSSAVAFMKAQSYIESVAKEIKEGKYPFKVLIIDSVTKMISYGMRYVLSSAGQLGKAPFQQHWGILTTLLENTLLTIKTLPLTVLLLAHQQIDEEEGVRKVEMAIPGKRMPELFSQMADEILYLKVRGFNPVERTIQTMSSGTVTCRSRTNAADGMNADEGFWSLIKRMGFDQELNPLTSKSLIP